VSEQRPEPGEIAVPGGLKEPSCQLVALLARRLEARPALPRVASGAGGELAHVVRALSDDRRDLPMPVVEHVVKQQHGSLLGREAPTSTSTASDSESAVSACRARSSWPSVMIGCGSHSPTSRSRWARAERSSLIASRVVTVAANARGDAICSPT
jgi:hypothetical protein